MVCKRFSQSSPYTSVFPPNEFKDRNAIIKIIPKHNTFPTQSL
ncbi:hypothetical protein T4D_6597 [Trichinella pseudospiralis]|uniref:Uncharacterized protein n=1 Tax=Trichinella pseudospiralis TaxID=6337 RepID=A0A0V1DLL1_TRIPS|nr:hypothetical protein T4D_6597 [Trichinella pseudospiralis]